MVRKEVDESKIIGDLTQKVSIRERAKHAYEYVAFISQIEPKYIDDALNDKYWILAMQEELNQFERNGLWDLVLKPNDYSIAGTKWDLREYSLILESKVFERSRILLAHIEKIALENDEANFCLFVYIFGQCMQKRNNLNLVHFDLEIERTFKRHQRENLQVVTLNKTMAKDNNNNGNNAINLVPEENRALRDYTVPLLQGLHQSIRRPSINENNFEIKPTYIQILRLFLFPLRDKAKSWLNSQPNRFITTWEDLAQKFILKFFLPTKTTNMRNNITLFKQVKGESLYETWERFKELLRRCPHHGIPDWLQVQTFYNRLVGPIKTTIDLLLNAAVAYNLLEEMALNNYKWPSERSSPRKVVGAYEIDALNTLTAQIAVQVATLSKKFDTLGVHAIQNSFVVCDMCRDGHSSDQCPYNYESVQYVGNFYKQ
ncbi:Retrotransposon gag domain - like 10 [Theobroma cacao]|nr:Retrotransposon gag domain - like 10 [Theobroma cacao]